jgi:L-rhamnose mutarotase
VTRFCFLLNVKPDRLEEYNRLHRQVWSDMIDALRQTGWHNYSSFLRDDGLLVGYLETADFQKPLAGMSAREVNRRWQEMMVPFFQSTGGRKADESLQLLEEVFHLD